MTIKKAMINAASNARTMLGNSVSLVIDYVKNQQNPDGGFKGRSDSSDLYYTMFGIDCLNALDSKPNIPLNDYVKSYESLSSLDFIHICSYIQLVSSLTKFNLNLKDFENPDNKEYFRKKIECYRSLDGGYNVIKNSKIGSVYGCFLAVSAYEELNLPIPNVDGILQCLNKLKTKDGGFTNEFGLPDGITTATSAALILLKRYNQQIPTESVDWLLNTLHLSGGFLAFQNAPIPDLLSTATALHCLSEIGYDLSNLNDKCLDFLDTLWSAEGAFYGNWADNKADIEYTFYGLLSIGNLSK